MENRKKRTRFNIIDVFVILLIAALVFGIVYFILIQTGRLENSGDEKNVVYTLRISGVDEKYIDSIKNGSTAENSSTFSTLGTIIGVRTEKSLFYGNDAVKKGDGYEIRSSEYADRYDVYVTISAKGVIDARGILYINGQRITVGTLLYFRSGNFAADSYVTEFGFLSDEVSLNKSSLLAERTI